MGGTSRTSTPTPPAHARRLTLRLFRRGADRRPHYRRSLAVTGPRDTLVVSAPAKVNLFLHVTGRRDDGYHTLESLLALIDWCDTITLSRRADGDIARGNPMPGVPESEDLALAAARALKAATGAVDSVTIGIDKNIPQGAGLGGGSSDAASVLLALNRFWALGMPRSELAAIGATLGADVPFLSEANRRWRAASASCSRRCSLPTSWIALVVPPVEVATESGLRGAAIDTIRRVGENRRLFRGLRTKRSPVGCRVRDFPPWPARSMR